MSLDLRKDCLRFLSWGLVLGCLAALFTAVLKVFANGYLGHGMYRIAILTLRSELNRWILLFAGLSLVYVLAGVLVFRGFHVRSGRSPGVLVFLLAFLYSVLGVRTALGVFSGHTLTSAAKVLYFRVSGVLAGRMPPASFVHALVRHSHIVLFFLLGAISGAVLLVLAIRIVKKKTAQARERPRQLVSAIVVGSVLLLNAGLFADSRLRPPAGPNVLLISIDTLRYDALGVNGCDLEGITPNIDAFAGRAIHYKVCVTQSPWTLPAHMTMLTSLGPETHGLDTPEARFEKVAVDPAVVTLAEMLRDRNYSTAAITGGGYVHSAYGFSQGFIQYDNDGDPMEKGVEKLKDLLTRWQDRRFFVFYHTYSVHAPYIHTDYLDRLVEKGICPEGRKKELQQFLSGNNVTKESLREKLIALGVFNKEVCKNLYLAGVHDMDRHFGSVVRHLDRLNLMKNTLVVFTADHGEEFGEHNPECFYDLHHQGLFEEHVRVPLLIYRPDSRSFDGREVHIPVGLIDIMPTVLAYLNVPSPEHVAGINVLQPVILENRGGEERPLISETHLLYQVHLRSMRIASFKYILNCQSTYQPEREGLYDLRSDPHEQRNLASEAPLQCREFAGVLEEHDRLAKTGVQLRTTQTELSKELESQLKSLGYLQ
jgi:arylsulfatase A-like enzyme